MTADDKRGRELAELARQFLLWIRDNELPGVPGLRGAQPDFFQIHAGIYRKLKRSRSQPFNNKLIPNAWSGEPAEQKRFQELRLGITHVLLINNPVDLITLPDGRQLERNRIVPASRDVPLDRPNAMIAVSPSLDSLEADDATLGLVRNYDFSAILPRTDLVYDDDATAAQARFRYRFIFTYDTPREEYKANVQDLLVPAQLDPGPVNNRAEILAQRVRAFREYLYQHATYENRKLVRKRGGDYYKKWRSKDSRKRQFRPTQLTDDYLEQCFTEFVMKQGDDLLLIDLPQKRVLYRLLWEPPKRNQAAPHRFTVQALLTISGTREAPPTALRRRGRDDNEDPGDSGLRFPVTAVFFHALEGEDHLPNVLRFGDLDYKGGPAKRFVVDYKAALREYYKDMKLDFGTDRQWFNRFVEVFFADQSYPVELSFVPNLKPEALFLAVLAHEASAAEGPLKQRLTELVAWCKEKPNRYVFLQGMTFGTEENPRELIGVTLSHVFEWHSETEIVTQMNLLDWLDDIGRGELFGEVARNTAGMLPFITLVTWGGLMVMGGGVLGLGGALGGLARTAVPQLLTHQAGKFISREAVRKALPKVKAQLIAMLVEGIMSLLPKSDHLAYQFLHGLFEGFGGGAVEHYLSEIDERLERQVKKIPAIAANLVTKGGYRAYVVYEKVSSAAVKLAGALEALKVVLTDERAEIAARELRRLGQHAGTAFLIILFVVIYLDFVYRKHRPNEVVAWVEKQKKTLLFMVQETGDEIKRYADELQAELRALRNGLSGSQASSPKALGAVRRQDKTLSHAIAGKLKDGFDKVPAVADFLQLLFEEMGVENWDELKRLSFGELMSRGFDALPKGQLASDQAHKLGAALGQLIGTIMMERQIVPKGVREKGKHLVLFDRHPLHRAANEALAGGTWRALWTFAIYPFRNLGQMPETLKRGLEEQVGREDKERFSKAKRRDTAYQDLLRDVIGDEEELARRLIRLAEEEGLTAHLERLVLSAKANKANLLPPDFEALTKGDNPDWPTDAILFVLYTWLRLGLREIYEAFGLIKDDKPYEGKFRLSQLLDIIGLDIALDDETVAALRHPFTRGKAARP